MSDLNCSKYRVVNKIWQISEYTVNNNHRSQTQSNNSAAEVKEIVVHEATMKIYQSLIKYNRINKVQQKSQDDNQVQAKHNNETGIDKTR